MRLWKKKKKVLSLGEESTAWEEEKKRPANPSVCFKKDLPPRCLEVGTGSGALFGYGAGSIYGKRMKAVIIQILFTFPIS